MHEINVFVLCFCLANNPATKGEIPLFVTYTNRISTQGSKTSWALILCFWYAVRHHWNDLWREAEWVMEDEYDFHYK